VATWTPDELDRIGSADEFHIASVRSDGTLRPYVTIWGVRVGDELYIRSAHGGDNPWYRRALASGTGRVKAGGIEHDVSFADVGADIQSDIDAAYRSKYDRYGAALVRTVAGEQLHGLTIKLDPR
jgi:hypothetical protein